MGASRDVIFIIFLHDKYPESWGDAELPATICKLSIARDYLVFSLYECGPFSQTLHSLGSEIGDSYDFVLENLVSVELYKDLANHLIWV